MSLLTQGSFHYRQNEFFCDDLSLSSLAERFGTSAYIYSQSTILGNYARLRGMARIPSLICYAVKANSHLRILSLLRQAGAGFDVVSGGELARALRAGASPATIVFSGVGKTQVEIDAGLAAGIMMFNVESAGEPAAMASSAGDMADVQPGDLLAVLTAGAYGYVLSSNYNTRPRPAEVLVQGAEAGLIRPRETLEILMAGETT
jgi:diaminopimelate decarboxylase